MPAATAVFLPNECHRVVTAADCVCNNLWLKFDMLTQLRRRTARASLNRAQQEWPSAMINLFPRSVVDLLGGYDDMNNTDRLCGDSVTRRIVDGRAIAKAGASISRLGLRAHPKSNSLIPIN